jgi:predicted enzyme related to lactoylglutathione lyase
MPQGVMGGQETSTLFCCYAVHDLAAALDAVRVAGGTTQEPTDAPYGPTAMCTDDAGTAFALYEPRSDDVRPASNGRRQGDLAYVTFEVQDSARHRAFYSAVLGWRSSPGTVDDGWAVDPTDVHPMVGIAGGQDRDVTLPMWLVDDVAAAVERVRAAGGTSSEVQQQPYGLMADCADDQGGRFYLGQH